MSLLMPRSSFDLGDNGGVLEVSVAFKDLRALSHSAMATFNQAVSSARASFAPDCSSILYKQEVGGITEGTYWSTEVVEILRSSQLCLETRYELV